eukprot:403361976
METSQQNILYLYGLPKDNLTSLIIAIVIKDLTNYEVKVQPQINRDLNKQFYSAMVKINDTDEDEFKQIARKMKYFEIDSKPCRALPYSKQAIRSLGNEMGQTNVLLVKNLDKSITSQQLDEIFAKVFGEDAVLSAKVSVNADYSSNGHGQVIFACPQLAEQALAKAGEFNFQISPYQPKDRRELRKSFNNIYIKNFPSNWNKEQIEQIFGKYGTIKSTVIKMDIVQGTYEEAPYAFVCYEDPENKEYGPKCAQNAITLENDQEYDGFKLYVKAALPMTLREQEKKIEQNRFKNYKKGCNLYVKNFPDDTTEEQLQAYFENYGEIESIKLNHKDGKAVYAFVCYKDPESAAFAKQQSQTETFHGKQLFINFYEQKEVRLIQQEDARDRTDFTNLRKQSLASALNIDIQNRPETFQLLQYLMLTIQKQQQNQRYNDPQRQGGNMQLRGPRQPYNNQGAYQQRNQQLPQGQIPSQMSNPNGQPQQPPQGIPLSSVDPSQTIQHLPPYIFAYNQYGINKILPLVTISNPNYKYQVGEHIYEHVESLAGEDLTPKITGMLIDLPIAEIQAYVTDFTKLQIKINEAYILLKSSQYKIE